MFDPLDQLPHLLTVPEAAKILRMSPRAYYYHAQRNRVPSVKLGHRVYVPKAEIRRFLGLNETAGDESVGDSGARGR